MMKLCSSDVTWQKINLEMSVRYFFLKKWHAYHHYRTELSLHVYVQHVCAKSRFIHLFLFLLLINVLFVLINLSRPPLTAIPCKACHAVFLTSRSRPHSAHPPRMPRNSHKQRQLEEIILLEKKILPKTKLVDVRGRFTVPFWFSTYMLKMRKFNQIIRNHLTFLALSMRWRVGCFWIITTR